MRRQNFYVRHFKCEYCGSSRPATKRSGSKTPIGHCKHMWCPVCQEETKHIQVE